MAEGVKSSTWIFLLRALEVLEQDFARFDKSGDGYIDYVELTMGLPMCDANQKLSIMTRLEYKFKQVDLDHTNTVDFYEFIYLGFLMTQVETFSAISHPHLYLHTIVLVPRHSSM
jgi:Ca2+-binding EF-hand superfamily protein